MKLLLMSQGCRMELKNYRVLGILVSLLASHSAFALTDRDIAHLLGRTGFGLASSIWSDFEHLDRNAAVELILSRQVSHPVTPEPDFVESDVYQRLFSGDLSKPEKDALRKEHVNKHRRELSRWWWSEMLATQSTLNERMVLFWHGHFTSDVRKTHAPFIYEQNQVFRKYGMGDFRILFNEVIKGPAVQLFLDNTKNRKGKPNENLARELLELYSLGVGNYTEDDVRGVARALTGWKVSKDRKTMVFKVRHHDGGEKTILGKTGRWDFNDVLDLLLELPETHEFLTTSLWHEFISPEPDRTEVKRLSRLFRESDYSIKALLKGLLNSDAFWAEANRNVLVKSPIELAVGAMRDYSVRVPELGPIMQRVTASGQQLFYPPDVKGWRGHSAWLSSDSIVQRQLLLENLLWRKQREYRQDLNNIDPKLASVVANDFNHYTALQQIRADDSLSFFEQLEQVLLNDFYQLK